MILAIDAGNSRVKWGWYADGWSSIANVSLIEFAASSDHVNPFSATHENPERILISNVAGDGAQQLIVNWTSVFEAPPEWIHGEREQCGVRNLYERPEQLGPDRWASLIAARALEPGRPCLVVNAGTCTTIDMLSASGEFTGGLILPGIELMRFVLHEHTGRLPLQEGSFVAAPRRTADAIETGCRLAQAGAVERMFGAMGSGAQCLVSGGGGPALIERLDLPCRYVENLVLEGLARIGTA
ncbi:MAG TPA: type III pantothenate kinase [Burkholderiales bacterium]|jgi:type III pantothenate kinase|nr:type III pantothenate kinase [Burkholderiales bacterium]